MSAIRLSATAGPDGVLHLDVPVGTAGVECDVVIVTKPAAVPGRPPTPEELGWSKDFLENVMGSIDDDTFGVHIPRDLPPKRVSLE